MRRSIHVVAIAAFVAGLFPLALASAARADEWHRSLEDGLAASARSGKPTLLVTLWREKV